MDRLMHFRTRRVAAAIVFATLLVLPVAFNTLQLAEAASVPPGFLADRVKKLFMTPGRKVLTSGDTTVTIDVVISGKASRVTLTHTEPDFQKTITFTVRDESTPQDPDVFIIVRPDNGKAVRIDRRTPFDPNVLCQANTTETPNQQTSGSQTCYSAQLVALRFACGQAAWGVSVTIDRTNPNNQYFVISWSQSPNNEILYDATTCTIPLTFQKDGSSYWQYNNAVSQKGPIGITSVSGNTGQQAPSQWCTSSCGATATVNWNYAQQ